MGGGYSAAMPEQASYYAKVPPNGKAGDVISADINGRPVKVRVPPGTSVGQLFKFTAADCVTAPPGSYATTPGQPNFGQPAMAGPSSAGGAVLTPYHDNPQPGVHYTTNPNQAGRPVASNPPLSVGQTLVQQQQYSAVPQQPQQPSTAHMSGAQIVQQFGYQQQQAQQTQMMMPANTPFPQQPFQQQPHYMMIPQQHQQPQMMMMQPQQMMIQQQYAPQQQYMAMPQQQYAMQPQYGAPQMQMMQQQQQSGRAVQAEIPVATPIQEGYHGGATIVR